MAITLTERRIGLSAKQLSDATLDIQNKTLSEKQIRDNYLKALYNENIIELCDSECDRRSKISYPLINKNKININTYGHHTLNFLTDIKINVINPIIYPSKQYLNSWIRDILNYALQNKEIKIISHDKKYLSVDELIDRYSPNPEDYFNLIPQPTKTEGENETESETESDHNDKKSNHEQENENENKNKNSTHPLEPSQPSQPSPFPPNCYYCDYNQHKTKGYDNHVVIKHSGYPGPADIKALDLKPQGMSWEV